MALSLRTLRFEPLEDKTLLAGDVAVSVIHGALMITGDELGNQIAVSSGEEPGEYLIRGLDGTMLHSADDGDAGDSELLVTGVRLGIHIDLKEGDDAVAISAARVRGNVVIRTGAGSDQVSVGLSPVAPDPLLVEAALVDSEDLAGGVSIGGSLLIHTGADNDTVRLGGHPEGNPELSDDSTEEGIDPSTLRVGRNLVVGLGAGEDRLAIDAAHVRMAIVANGGHDSDAMNVTRTHARLLTLHGGGGEFADTVSMNHVYASIAGIGTGGGNDQVDIVDSAFGVLGVRAGGGDDTVSVGGTKARLAVLVGGEGTQDTWNDQGNNQFAHQIVRGFELPVPSEANEEAANSESAQTSPGPIEALRQGILSRLAGRLVVR
jgi:hypothetical protein